MSTTPAEDFAAWLAQQTQQTPAPAEPTVTDDTPGTPKPDLSQGGKDAPLTTSPGDAFARLINDAL
ncbi:hypothetical protein [Phycicoccus avicenniae]|uniref:hypothetical protein n=1 Tax=Phycicoccus avicenniae TaxID=2828860 RepID=UPI003D2E606E